MSKGKLENFVMNLDLDEETEDLFVIVVNELSSYVMENAIKKLKESNVVQLVELYECIGLYIPEEYR